MSTTEFSRLVSLTRLGSEPFHQHVAADAAERAALARRFDLMLLDSLEADIELRREPGGTFLLTADFAAVFAQECVVTNAPVPGVLNEYFQLRYGLPQVEDEAPSGDDDPAFEPLEGDAIDLGEAIAQEFSLALPPFPRSPDAVIEIDEAKEEDAGPFAALAKFRRGEPQ